MESVQFREGFKEAIVPVLQDTVDSLPVMLNAIIEAGEIAASNGIETLYDACVETNEKAVDASKGIMQMIEGFVATVNTNEKALALVKKGYEFTRIDVPSGFTPRVVEAPIAEGANINEDQLSEAYQGITKVVNDTVTGKFSELAAKMKQFEPFNPVEQTMFEKASRVQQNYNEYIAVLNELRDNFTKTAEIQGFTLKNAEALSGGDLSLAGIDGLQTKQGDVSEMLM